MRMYRGGVGQWAWLLHRVTGVGVLVFLCIHVAETSLVVLGPELYDSLVRIYRQPLFKILEILLFAAVLFHALNGLRIILFDFWVSLMAAQARLFRIQMILFAALMIPVTWIMLSHL